MHLETIVDRLDSELNTDAFSAIDGSPNGLQVTRPLGSISTAAVAVDAAASTIDTAITRDAELLITHHGLWWDGIERVTGPTYRRLESLIRNDVALYVSHLPLDAHQTIGNAAVIAADLKLVDREPFGRLDGEFIGQQGRFETPISRTGFIDSVAEILPDSASPHILPHGPETIETVGIITGSGVDWIDEASSLGLDMLVTGEGKHSAYHASKESDLNVLLGGHYATETGGVRAIAGMLSEWGIETTFIDEPSGL